MVLVAHAPVHRLQALVALGHARELPLPEVVDEAVVLHPLELGGEGLHRAWVGLLGEEIRSCQNHLIFF